jgi:two-component system chemotaxis sensor kinase CheA
MASDTDDSLLEFLAESDENLDGFEEALLGLERAPEDAELVTAAFRFVHSIKGTAGFFGFDRIGALTHAGESVLSRMRDRELTLTPAIAGHLFAMSDATRQLLAGVRSTGNEPAREFVPLLAELAALTPPDPMWPAPAPAPVALAAPAKVSPAAPVVSVAVTDESDEPLTTVRVDVHLLDTLISLVGELVLTRNQLLQVAGRSLEPAFQGATQRLNHITSELQERVMKTRMQPIRNVWNRLPRVIRDLSAQCGKQVRVEMIGGDTELDKTIVEAIRDPLTHMVRNAVDHGIESAERRVASGKPAEGRLTLRAAHENGRVIMDISDDGGGIDPEKIRAKALERGLLPAEQLGRMTAHELVQLIFLPGFSTAEKVSNISGRGVGMDVVKHNIERIGGQVEVLGMPGVGTTLRMKVPLTLAIVSALVVQVGDERYAIPQANLSELVGLPGTTVGPGGVEIFQEVPVYRLRDTLLPLAFLGKEMGRHETWQEALAACGEAPTVVVLQTDGRLFGLVVDGVCDSTEIVVKPLSAQLKSLLVFAGATILGDGRVALILDVLNVARRAGVGSEGRRHVPVVEAPPLPLEGGAPQTLLVFDAGGGRRGAVPLAGVERLESLDRGRVQDTGGKRLVRYRDAVMPLHELAPWVGGVASQDSADSLHVLVCARPGGPVGLVVTRILDVIEGHFEVHAGARRDGVAGAVVLGEQVTDLVDLERVLEAIA